MNYDRGTRNPQASANTGLTETGYLFVQKEDSYTQVFKPSEIGKVANVSAADRFFLNFGFDAGNPAVKGDAVTILLTAAAAIGMGGKNNDDFGKAYGEIINDATVSDLANLKAKIDTEIIDETMFNNLKAAYMRLYPSDCYEFVSSSAIVAAPGPDTGEMLVAYPQTTAHSVEVAPEEMKMQMRKFFYKCPFQS